MTLTVNMDKPKTRRIKTSERVFDIIKLIKEMDDPGVTTIAEELDISKSTVYLHLSTLEELEYIVHEGDSYRLSLRFLENGEHVRRNFDMAEVMQPALEHVADDTGEVTAVTVEEHGWCITIGVERGSRAVQIFDQIGRRTYLHAHAPGKAILASKSDEEVEEIIDLRGLPALTPETITDREQLFDELETIRDQGFALDRGEGAEGLYSVAAPIKCNETIGSIGVSGPLNRVTSEEFHEEHPDIVRGAANEIRLRCQYGSF